MRKSNNYEVDQPDHVIIGRIGGHFSANSGDSWSFTSRPRYRPYRVVWYVSLNSLINNAFNMKTASSFPRNFS